MMKYLILIILMFLTKFAISQEIPQGYKHLVTLDLPKLKDDIPHEILMDTINNLFIIAYGFKPTYLDCYQLHNWKTYKRIKMKGWVHLTYSYFSEDGQYLYVDQRSNRSLMQVNLETLEQIKFKCKDAPKGCLYKENSSDIDDVFGYDPFYTLIREDKYVILYEPSKNQTSVYIR